MLDARIRSVFLASLVACGDRGSRDEMTTADTGRDPIVGDCRDPVSRQALPSQTLGSDGLSERLDFTIPECATSYLLTVSGPDDVLLALERLVSPSGERWIEGPTPFGQLSSPVPMAAALGVASAFVSNSDVPFETGSYRARIEAGRPQGLGLAPFSGEIEVELLWKNVDTLAEGGELDINLYFSGAADLSAANAPTSVVLQAALDGLAETYAQVGIALGDVSYADIPAEFRTITSLDGPDNDLSRMFSLSGGSAGGLNLFFVERFDVLGGLGDGIGGISGGLPGPALRPGSPRSGVAVALQATRDVEGNQDPALLAHVMAHEGGHYLGLFHTVEVFGGGDPLADTPEGLGETTNLMFPTVGGDTQLTPSQARVVHQHPEVTLEDR